MTKAALLISGILLFAGVAAASSGVPLLGGSDTPTVDTPTLSTSTGDDIRREDRRADEDEVEDLRGPCDEAEHANDPRCTGAAGVQTRDDDGDRRNRGPGNTDDSGHDDGSSGNRGGNSGPGGGDDD
jgi:hypothetical protein